jgi:hypothetical protein
MSDWYAIDWFGQEWFSQDWFAGEQAEGAMSATLTGSGGASGQLTAIAWMSATIGGSGTIGGALELIVSESDDDGVGPIDSGGARRKKPRDDKPRAPRVFDTYTAPVLSSSSADNLKPGRVRSDGRRNAVALALLMLDEDWYG